jgi:hypothetical protein
MWSYEADGPTDDEAAGVEAASDGNNSSTETKSVDTVTVGDAGDVTVTGEDMVTVSEDVVEGATADDTAQRRPIYVRPLGPQFPELFVSPNAGCGDCQFWALAQALNGYVGSGNGGNDGNGGDSYESNALAARLRELNLTPSEVSAAQLRQLTYAVFLLPSPETDGYLAHWKTNSGDPSMGDAYRHARFLGDKRIDTLSIPQRQELFRILMDARQTWGDETSLIILERLLHVRVDVILDGHLQIRDMCHPPGFVPIVYTIMNLAMKHYECVIARVGGGFATAFATPQLPLPIVALHLRDCTAAVDAYVRLVEPAGAPPLPPQPPYEDTMLTHLRACMDWLDGAGGGPGAGGGGPGGAGAGSGAGGGGGAGPGAGNTEGAYDGYGGGCAAEGYQGQQVEADGGVQAPGAMEATVCRLQCGLRVAHAPPYEPLFPAAFVPARIPRANPARLWS